MCGRFIRVRVLLQEEVSTMSLSKWIARTVCGTVFLWIVTVVILFGRSRNMFSMFVLGGAALALYCIAILFLRRRWYVAAAVVASILFLLLLTMPMESSHNAESKSGAGSTL